MRKKMSIIIALSILTICLISNFSLATSAGNMIENTVSDGAEAIENGGAVVGNAMQDEGSMIENGMNNEGRMIENGIDKANNMIDDKMANGVINSQTIDDIGNGTKNVTESMTTDNVISGNNLSNYKILGVSLSVWMWIILIIIFIIIIVLICKYMKDHNDDDD